MVDQDFNEKVVLLNDSHGEEVATFPFPPKLINIFSNSIIFQVWGFVLWGNLR